MYTRTCDSVYDLDELLLVRSKWGPCCDVTCPDIGGDDVIGLDELLFVLSHWGSCA